MENGGYYASVRDDGQGYTDIYMVNFLPEEQPAQPQQPIAAKKEEKKEEPVKEKPEPEKKQPEPLFSRPANWLLASFRRFTLAERGSPVALSVIFIVSITG